MQGSFFGTKSAGARLALAIAFLFVLTLLIAGALPPISRARQEKAPGGASQKPLRPEFVPGEALVRYSSERIAKLQTLQTLVSSDGRQLAIQLERFDGSDIVPGLRIAHVAAADTMAAIEALKKQPDVLYAEPNYLLHLDVTPNDPRFTSGELYGLTKIGAPTAWNTTTGSSSVVVGVIDEGIDKLHPDLGTNIWTNPAEIAANGIDDDSNGFIDDVNGYNFASDTGTIPAENHATHVAGTIGGVGNNGVGVVGVNWQVGLMSLRFIGGTAGSTSNAIRANNYAKQMHDLWISTGGLKGANVRVLNNSYGGGGFSQSFLDAINALNQSGILFVASAGNFPDSPQPDNDLVPHYPGSYDAPNVISVASTDSSDGLSSFSHYGLTSVHLGAPGTGILSTTANNTYTFFNGTSMATPHVVGAAALLLAQNPNLTVQQLKSLLIFNGDPVGSLSGKTITGRRLSVANSMQAVIVPDTTPPGTVTSFQINSQVGRALNVGWTASGDDGGVGQASLYELSFTDAISGTVILLKRTIPAASGVAQAVDVKIPYRHTNGTLTLREFDNSGNEGVAATTSVSVSLIVGDPYLTSLGSSAALSTGGTALNLIGDDKLRLNHVLPFTFPFFGENFSTVNISTNGNLFFSAPPTRANGDADDVPGSSIGLAKFKMISGLWDDLRTDSAAGACSGCDVFVVTPDPSRVIFRWKGVTFGAGDVATEFPVNFEIELRTNGTILTRYGTGQSAPINTNLLPVVGIAGGEPDPYVIPSHTSEQVFLSLTNAPEVTFLPRGPTTVASLTVASSNPASGASVTVSPNDENGMGNGTTQFARTYQIGSLVNLAAAPTAAGGNVFQKWQRDGVDWATTPATTVTMDVAHTMTAVYGPPRTLTVASANPSSGVNITVSPADVNGSGDGATPFARTYADGIVVNLTAPATAGGNLFQKWQRDGADWATTLATSVTMDVAHTMTAVYVTPHTLTVASTNPASGVNITVSPNDGNGLGNGTTPFARAYAPGTVVSLTAPATASGNNFLKWQVDGVDSVTTPATSVTMGTAHTMTAVYVTPRTLTVASSFPDSGVSITVTPNDNGGLSSGTTQFSRTYNDGTVVNLTAPASAGGNPFKLWQRDGIDLPDPQTTSVMMDGNHTMTAVFNNSVQFSVPQFPNVPEAETPVCSNPACGSSATITVTRGGSTATPASVDYTTSDGVAPPNATQKGDYIISAGRLNFAVGETSKTFKVFIVDDVFQEGIEKFQVVLSNPVGTSLGVRSVADVPILDNDLFPPTTNPLNNADGRFYVREHYVDFLNREPDAGGFAFWTDQITSCGTDQACIALRRINVSAAFFLSIEFQETGYLVERLYKASYGDATGTSTFGGTHQLPVPIVRYTEFMADSQEISRGVVIGQPGADQLLESNKQAFIASFVQRSRFTTVYSSMTSAQFVDALNTNAGGVLTPAERNQLVSDLDATVKTRAQVLRIIAEDSDLNNAEKNRAFVLMQYFGYLRRNPNDPPESGLNYTGYDFWLSKLVQFNGNFVSAQMVEAFIVSGEYKDRFGP